MLRKGGTQAEAFREAFDLIDLAEETGLDLVWLGEMHFNPERSVLSAPIVVASAIASRTKRLRVGMAVLAACGSEPSAITATAVPDESVSEPPATVPTSTAVPVPTATAIVPEPTSTLVPLEPTATSVPTPKPPPRYQFEQQQTRPFLQRRLRFLQLAQRKSQSRSSAHLIWGAFNWKSSTTPTRLS